MKDKAMTDYRLVTYKTANGARAGVVIGDDVHDAASATRNAQYASVLANFRSV